MKKGQKGFTLLELLVAIAILGILAAVAIPNVKKFIDSANNSAAKTELSMVQVAEVAFQADHNGGITTDIDNLAPYLNSGLSWNYTIGDDGSVTQGTK